jgi:hypothetical protein
MVNTSIVLGLAPADSDSYHRLEAMFDGLDQVYPLKYGLTPHITLAYYRPGIYHPKDASRLAGALRSVDMEIVLRLEDLVLQNFCDMNHYFISD